MAKMHPPRVPEKLVPVVAEGDIVKLFKAVSGQTFEDRRDRAIISLFFDCGLRIGEMASIRLSDVDMEAREITVTGKGARSRRVRFVRETRGDLNRYLLHRKSDSDWLWLGRRGKLTGSGIYRILQRRCDEAGIPRFNPHRLRHTFAHEYLAAGGNEGDLMRVTGWKSRAMVDRYGASVADSRARDAHDAFSPRRKLR
jgi:integrase